MAEERKLIVDADAARKIDEYRGDMNRSEVISYGLAPGKQPEDKTFAEPSQKLQARGSSGNKPGIS